MHKSTKYLNVTQAAGFMGISRQYFYNMIKMGFIPEPIIRIGKRGVVLYDRNEIKKAKIKWKSDK